MVSTSPQQYTIDVKISCPSGYHSVVFASRKSGIRTVMLWWVTCNLQTPTMH